MHFVMYDHHQKISQVSFTTHGKQVFFYTFFAVANLLKESKDEFYVCAASLALYDLARVKKTLQRNLWRRLPDAPTWREELA